MPGWPFFEVQEGRVVPALHEAGTNQDGVVLADLDAVLAGDGLGYFGGDGEVVGQDVDALGAGDVEQHAAAHDGGHALDAVLGHAAAAGLDLGRFEAAAHDSVAGKVGKRVEMSTGVAAHDDQLVGRAKATRAHGVAVTPLQSKDVGRM